MMRMKSTLGLCALCVVSFGLATARAATIDGFTVSSLAPPRAPAVPVATDASLNSKTRELSMDNVLYLTKTTFAGSSPYSGVLANHAAYLSIQENGYAAFSFPQTASTLLLNWGTIGSDDTAVFYAGDTEIGALSGADLAAVYGASSTVYLSVTSPVPFTLVVLQEGADCCFEFSNLSAQ